MRGSLLLLSLVTVLVATTLLHLGWGLELSPGALLHTLMHGQEDSYDQAVLLHQRLPRALIAVHAGSLLAACGVVLQGLVRNPLASPGSLGLNAGAALAVLVAALVFGLDSRGQGLVAVVGSAAGLAATVLVARVAGSTVQARGLMLIVAGALISMLCLALGNALLLLKPEHRLDMLGWLLGNINHVHIERLHDVWWLGLCCLLVLQALARPLTLILLGEEKAASVGVHVRAVSALAMLAVMLGCGAAVAVCGPIGFVGLVVPHLVRPFTGANLPLMLPAAALLGAILCLLADLCAQRLFLPHVLNTGLLMELLGGIVFAVLVQRIYLARPRTHRP